MEARDLRPMVIKKARQEILATLNAMYHIAPLDFACICQALVHLELPDDECIKRDLLYLCEKDYVQWTNEKAYTPWAKRMFKLTARGNEIAERIDRDPALEP